MKSFETTYLRYIKMVKDLLATLDDKSPESLNKSIWELDPNHPIRVLANNPEFMKYVREQIQNELQQRTTISDS